MPNPSIKPLVMPKWGLSMKEGTLSAWHVEEGQTILPGQEIMDVDGGLLRRRVGEIGQVYPVKALLGILAPEDVSDAEIDAFVSAFEVPAAGDDDEDEGPAYQFAETASGRLRYAERPGEGHPIVFIHGFGGDLNNWMFNIDGVAAAGPVYALDLLGHGGSAKAIANPGLDALADAVEQFLQAVGLKGVHLVGHSMGGATASAVALRGRDLVKSLP
jgi:pyruvate dehydrogenase E2 component (dihydrolipoamide acetyltransferase)